MDRERLRNRTSPHRLSHKSETFSQYSSGSLSKGQNKEDLTSAILKRHAAVQYLKSPFTATKVLFHSRAYGYGTCLYSYRLFFLCVGGKGDKKGDIFKRH